MGNIFEKGKDMRRKTGGKQSVSVKKGAYAAAFLLITALTFGGCGGDYPDLSDEQVERAGEYAAMMLLKYDSLNRSRLMSVESMQKEEARREAWAKAVREGQKQSKEEEKEESQSDPSGNQSDPIKVIDNTVTVAGLSDGILLPPGVEIGYKGYAFLDQYPEGNSGFAVTAGSGNKLLLLKFSLSNENDGSESINLMEQDISYVITVNGSYSRRSLITLLEDDLSSYVGKLMPGESTELVLVIEVEQGTAVESLKLRVKNDRIEYTIPLEP